MARMGLHSDYCLAWNSVKVPAKPKVNKNTENYDDDGTVITMTLSKFFGAYRDYSGFLNDGARAYISLTDDETQEEVFQFSLLDNCLAPADELLQRSCVVKSGDPKPNVKAAFDVISESESPLLLTSRTGRVFGVLYPSVVLDEEPHP